MNDSMPSGKIDVKGDSEATPETTLTEGEQRQWWLGYTAGRGDRTTADPHDSGSIPSPEVQRLQVAVLRMADRYAHSLTTATSYYGTPAYDRWRRAYRRQQAAHVRLVFALTEAAARQPAGAGPRERELSAQALADRCGGQAPEAALALLELAPAGDAGDVAEELAEVWAAGWVEGAHRTAQITSETGSWSFRLGRDVQRRVQQREAEAHDCTVAALRDEDSPIWQVLSIFYGSGFRHGQSTAQPAAGGDR